MSRREICEKICAIPPLEDPSFTEDEKSLSKLVMDEQDEARQYQSVSGISEVDGEETENSVETFSVDEKLETKEVQEVVAVGMASLRAAITPADFVPQRKRKRKIKISAPRNSTHHREKLRNFGVQ